MKPLRFVVFLVLLAGCASRPPAPAACTETTVSMPCDAFATLPDGSKLACHVCQDAAKDAPVDGCTLHLSIFEEPTASYTVLCVASCGECTP